MTGPATRAPLAATPLIAVLAAAGSFLFAVAWFRPPQAAVERPPVPASLAVRVLGAQAQGQRDLTTVAADVAWLRAQGASVVVVEAWLDEDSVRLNSLTRLAQTLLPDPLVVLGMRVEGGQGPPVQPSLRRRGYAVTLGGHRQELPQAKAVILPAEELLAGSARVGAVVSAAQDLGPAVEMDGLWFNGLGLEAARIHLKLPMEALRFRWKKGAWESLELKNRRHALDDQGRIKLKGHVLPATDLAGLWQNAALAQSLKGKAVFYRPWPLHLSGNQDWEAQEAFFCALVEDAPIPEKEGSQGRGRSWLVLGGLAVWVAAYFLWRRQLRAAAPPLPAPVRLDLESKKP